MPAEVGAVQSDNLTVEDTPEEEARRDAVTAEAIEENEEVAHIKGFVIEGP